MYNNNNNDFSHIGRMIRRAVNGSLRLDGNAAKEIKDGLNSIGKEFSDLGDEIKREFEATTQNNKPPHNSTEHHSPPPPPPPPKNNYRYNATRMNNGPPHRSWGNNQPHTQDAAIEKYVPKTAPKTVIGILMLVFGGIGLGITTLLAIMFGLIIAFGTGTDFVGIGEVIAATLCVLGLSFGGSAGLIGRGKHFTKRNKRYKLYQKEIGGSDFCPIGMLSSAIGQTEKFVIKDLQKMIKHGMFPGGNMDSKQTCLILNYETYQQYLRAEEEMKKRQQTQADEKSRRSEKSEKKTGNSELDTVIAEGRDVILKIREANDRIPGEEISQKISHLEQVTSKIFEYVEQHPNKLPEIRKFMSYYLPTTLKLLNAYEEFDSQPVQGENISQGKLEIQNTLDTINKAFENLLDSLFGDVAMDISTDISVLESMLAQEGLTGSDFSSKK